MIPPVSTPVFAAVAGVVIVFLLYCVLTSNRVFGHLRRAGISILAAMVAAAAAVGYVDHVRHAQLVATAATGHRTSVLSELFIAWGFGSLVLSIPFFLVATWFVRRRAPRIGGGRRVRRAARRQAGPGLPGGGGIPEFPPALGGWPE